MVISKFQTCLYFSTYRYLFSQVTVETTVQITGQLTTIILIHLRCVHNIYTSIQLFSVLLQQHIHKYTRCVILVLTNTPEVSIIAFCNCLLESTLSSLFWLHPPAFVFSVFWSPGDLSVSSWQRVHISSGNNQDPV